jgi:hypothetical protein
MPIMPAILNLKLSLQLMIYVTPLSNELRYLPSYLSSQCDIRIGVVSGEGLQQVCDFNKGLGKSFFFNRQLVIQTFHLTL